jgi:uncharacterized membrane protein YdjX (TVP38/TMEM64 family)
MPEPDHVIPMRFGVPHDPPSTRRPMTESIGHWFHQLGALTPLSGTALGVFFLLAAFVVFPRTLLILTAGATFGLGAAPIILIGGTAGGILAFSLSRYLASAWFRKKLQRRPLLRAVAQAVDDEGWRIVALMRLGAPVPSALQNYLFGLTKINPVSYSISTLLFSAPQVFLFAFLGATGRASIVNDGSSGLPLGFSLMAIVLTVAIIALISWRVRSLLSHIAGSTDTIGK